MNFEKMLEESNGKLRRIVKENVICMKPNKNEWYFGVPYRVDKTNMTFFRTMIHYIDVFNLKIPEKRYCGLWSVSIVYDESVPYDVDNVAKMFLDGFTGIFYNDDIQVSEINVKREKLDKECAIVYIRSLNDSPKR